MRQTRWVHAAPGVVRVEVATVIPVDDPAEPSYDPQTAESLREVHAGTDAGNIEWLKGVARVHSKVSAWRMSDHGES